MIDRGEMDKRFYVSSFDGLRAIGILSIIIYSLYSYRLPGGFLGLDIFLILAGYFMTNRLMMSLMAEGKIPLKQILLKRLARIALPLIAMLILVFIYITLFQNEIGNHFPSYHLVYSLLHEKDKKILLQKYSFFITFN